MRLGLCCLFYDEDISFKTATATYLKNKSADFRKEYLFNVIFHNCQNLKKALQYCDDNDIRAFRITSNFFPLYTHPDVAYKIEDLEKSDEIFSLLNELKLFARKKDIRLTMHPGQFVILNSPREEVVQNSIEEINYHYYLLSLLGGNVINIHAGGVYQDKEKALLRLSKNLKKLKPPVKKLLTIENDDRNYTPYDLLDFCLLEKIPFVYDLHHHRCLKDNLSVEEVSYKALNTWYDKEPLFHLSSPEGGWGAKNIKKHANYIDINDFPKCWLDMKNITIDVEAKAKEKAVLDLMKKLKKIKPLLFK